MKNKKQIKPPKDEFRFKISQYPAVLCLWFYHGKTHKNKYMEGKAGMCQLFDDGRILITLDVDNEKDEEIYGTIVHELQHAKQNLEDIIESDLDRESEAYLIEDLYKKTVNAYKIYKERYLNFLKAELDSLTEEDSKRMAEEYAEFRKKHPMTKEEEEND